MKNKVNDVSWRKGWNLDMRRFHARQFRDDDSEGGALWQIIDLDQLRVAGLAENRKQAELIADALEFLSFDSTTEEFEAACANGTAP